MKTFLRLNLLAFTLLVGGSVHAQTTLALDQNPRYKESLEKYTRLADSLNTYHSTTLQNTYKAYDWYQAKQERKQQRLEWRHQERMQRLRYSPYNYNRYHSSNYGGWYSPYRYHRNRWF